MQLDKDQIVKGYEVAKGDYVQLEPEELEAVAMESKRMIDIDEFVPRKEIDELYFANPYYIVPDGEVGTQLRGDQGCHRERGNGGAGTRRLHVARACHRA